MSPARSIFSRSRVSGGFGSTSSSVACARITGTGTCTSGRRTRSTRRSRCQSSFHETTSGLSERSASHWIAQKRHDGAGKLGRVVRGDEVLTVDQRQKVIVFEFGKIKEIIEEPGLHFKWPLIQNVRYFDNRILTLDALETESFITSEKNNVLVDFFVKWRIKDLRQYYQRVQGDEATAVAQLQQTVKSTLQDEFTKRTVHDVVAGEREKIMGIVKVRAGRDASGYGIEIVGNEPLEG